MKRHNLKYSFLNEDPKCELAVMPAHTETLVCIAGSGFRVLPLLSGRQLKTVYIVDRSKSQMDHTRNILDLLNMPDHESFVRKINPTSSSSMIYKGQHEQSYFLRSRLLRLFFIGQFKPNVDLTNTFAWPIFAHVYARILKRVKRDHAPLHKYVTYLQVSFRKLMATAYLENFFWQQFLYGQAKTVDAFTALIPEKIWLLAKGNLNKVTIHYIEEDIVSFLSNKTNEIDFVSLSNVINYLSDTEKSGLASALANSLKTKGQVLIRSYIDPIELDSPRLTEDQSKTNLLESEMTGSYIMKVYEKI